MSLENKFTQTFLENKFLQQKTLASGITKNKKMWKLYKFNPDSPIVTLEIGDTTEEIDISDRVGINRLKYQLLLNGCPIDVCNLFNEEQ